MNLDTRRGAAGYFTNLLCRLFRRRERRLEELALDVQAGARPLTITEIRHPRFSAALPGVWREVGRTAEGCELVSAGGSQRLSVATRNLVVPLAANELAAAGHRLLVARRDDLAAGGSIAWSEPQTCCHDQCCEVRSDGYQPAACKHYAVLEQIAPGGVLSAVLSTHGDRSAQEALSNLATVLFDRLAGVE